MANQEFCEFVIEQRPKRNFINFQKNAGKETLFFQLRAEIKPRTFLSNLNKTKVNSQNHQDQAIVDWNITKSLGVECHQKLWKGWRAFPKIALGLFPQFPHATTRLFLNVELLLLS